MPEGSEKACRRDLVSSGDILARLGEAAQMLPSWPKIAPAINLPVPSKELSTYGCHATREKKHDKGAFQMGDLLLFWFYLV